MLQYPLADACQPFIADVRVVEQIEVNVGWSGSFDPVRFSLQ
jgi:hypothetical protein